MLEPPEQYPQPARPSRKGKERDNSGPQPTDLDEKIMALRRRNAACVSPYISLANQLSRFRSLTYVYFIFQLAQLDLETSPNETEVSSLRCWPFSSGRRRNLCPSLHPSFLPTAKKRGTKNSPRRYPQPMSGAKFHNLHIFHPNGMPNNRIPSFLAHSRHPKTAKKRQITKSSLGSYGSRPHQDFILVTIIANHPNSLIQTMIPYRQDGQVA